MISDESIKFTVMHRNEEVAKVVLTNNKKHIEIIKLIPDGIKQPFGGKRKDLARVYDFLKSRCYEDGRADLKEILEQAGLKSNNPWKWVRITHGVTYDDFFWIKFDGETLTWEEVKIR